MSKEEKDQGEEPRIRDVKDPTGTGAIVFPVPPGMAKRLREREARRKAEREALEEQEAEEKEDGADE